MRKFHGTVDEERVPIEGRLDATHAASAMDTDGDGRWDAAAPSHGMRRAVRLLQAHGADINARNGLGYTPLCLAALKQHR